MAESPPDTRLPECFQARLEAGDEYKMRLFPASLIISAGQVSVSFDNDKTLTLKRELGPP